MAAARQPARKDGAKALALLVLPWVVALAWWLLLQRHHHQHLDVGVVVAVIFGLAAVSIGLPAVWLAWVPVRNANRSGGAKSASSAGGSLGRGAKAMHPAGLVRVNEADLRLLGVHAAISVPGVPDEVPPEYVPRDADTAEFGVRARVAAAAERGGFVLLVGGSSVGKTRCAVEAVRALLPDWWLVHPAGPAEVAALALAQMPRRVVWLDELQRYLDGEHGLTDDVIRDLLGARQPTVIVGTLWPDQYTAYMALPRPEGADPHARERRVLDLAAVVRIAPEFSPAEQDRAWPPRSGIRG